MTLKEIVDNGWDGHVAPHIAPTTPVLGAIEAQLAAREAEALRLRVEMAELFGLYVRLLSDYIEMRARVVMK